jgi:superfamily I DNA/RNA helicase/RecB family exonuclease
VPCIWHSRGVTSPYDPFRTHRLTLLSVTVPGELTPRQQEAVAHRGANLLLEAVPGSGKTRVIVARCVSLLADGIPASEILLLTFSRRAVGELRDRLSVRLANQALPDIRTFHGFAARLLAETGNAGHSRRLLSEPAEGTLFRSILRSTPLRSLPTAAVLSPVFRDTASARVDELRRSSAEALAKLGERASPRIADLLALAAAQTQRRDRLGVADYDDLVARAVTLASTPGSALRQALHARYKHVLVDEFQDTDPLQLALVGQLSGEIFAVGDSAQAIYGFRGAARDALARARTDLTMTTLPLDESFRCPAAICDLARDVWPEPPRLHSSIDRVGLVTFRRGASPRDEAALIGAAVAQAIADGTPEREIAVLVRSAEPLARLVEEELRERGVASARQGGERVLDDPAVDAICAALKSLADSANPDCWRRLFCHPVFGVTPLPLRLAFDAAPVHSFEAACEFCERIEVRSRVSGARLAAALQSARDFWDAGDLAQAARSFAAESNVLGFVLAQDELDARRSSRRLTGFIDALADVRDVRARLGIGAGSAAAFDDFLACSESWTAGAEAVDDEPGVRILTIHAAKGLEFDFVVVADAVDNHFPQTWRRDALLREREIATARDCGVDLGTRAGEHLDEERSLWYVAVTRSKRKLLVTWSETDLDGSPQRPSRFIPLEARTLESHTPSFGGALVYAPAPELEAVATPYAARLPRPVGTSKIELWLDCRRKFYYAVLLRIGSDERTFKAKLGNLVHKTIQEFHATVRDFRTVDEGAHLAWALRLQQLARAIVAADPKFGFDSALETSAALRSAERLLERYARELEATARRGAGGFEVIASEESVRYDVAGVALTGKIDRVDRRPDGSLVLVDVKTGAFKREKAMTAAFPKLSAAASAGDLWVKATPAANPQLALYRHAKPETGSLAYLYLDARPKFADYVDAAHTDRLEIAQNAAALAALDEALAQTFFEPWTTGVTAIEPTRNARTCRLCEFVAVCPGYLEDDE